MDDYKPTAAGVAGNIEPSSAVRILHDRYIKGNPERLAAVELLKAEAKGEVIGYQEAIRELLESIKNERGYCPITELKFRAMLEEPNRCANVRK